MQQYHPNNIEQDPSRAMWNNSSEFIKENNNTNIFKKIIEENKKSKSDLHEVVFNNNNKESTIHSDIIEKDKEIQSLNFKLKQNEIDFNKLKKDLSVVEELRVENKILNQKLNEEYEKNKEISILKNRIQILEMENKNLKENKNIQNESINNNDDESSEEEIEEINTDNYNYSNIFEKLMKEKEKYKNDKLKDMICKYKNNADKSKIDAIFIEMKIDGNVEITKELITKIIVKL